MAAYATRDELAAALHIQVTAKNQDWLDTCCEAATIEVDQSLDRFDGTQLPAPYPALAVTTTVARAVEWWKANDAAFGGVGFADTGVLTVPRDSFARHAATLIPLVEQFGIA